jgi:hypothetical protein
MAGPEDEDPNHDWDENGATKADATAVAIGDPITAPHDTAELAAGLELELAKARDAGYRKGFADGQADCAGAFALTFTEAGLDAEEANRILLRVEGKLTRI